MPVKLKTMFRRDSGETGSDPCGILATSRRTEFQPGQCMQCDTPSCVAACPVDATYKQADGLVVIDPMKCIGCGNCVTACPYGARYRDPGTRRADKCDFCEHRLKRGEEPACVVTCPTKARTFGDLNDPNSEVSRMVKLKSSPKGEGFSPIPFQKDVNHFNFIVSLCSIIFY